MTVAESAPSADVSEVNKAPLLTRDAFREAVFRRDGYKCVLCGSPAEGAHHIMERRLFDDGGYYLDNGASVCGPCHMKCETTEVPLIAIREAAGIRTVILPDHLYRDEHYDKWGNPYLPNGLRLRGELFFDESVQKVLAGSLDLFTKYVKYPRSYHLPWSPGVTKDDRVMWNVDAFIGQEVVVSVKMDGEATSMYSDYIHARSTSYEAHPARSWVRAFHARIQGDIPEGWRVCGENLWAKHSIHYQNLPDYFMGYSIWSDHNECLSWDESLEWFELLGITPVPVLYRGIYGRWADAEDASWSPGVEMNEYAGDECEGYVIRVARQFSYGEFRNVVGKYVRKNHVQTTQHWLRGQKVEKNLLAGR